jgi:bifunctional UDP-N-acetylglucosamine pyrophosphorylase/glucosamine-1-phosphate N-acetyltransferase
MSLDVIVLAAGEGKRMRSALPKVLHPLAGRPLIAHVLVTARTLDPARIHVVYGHGGETLRTRLANEAVNWVEQKERLGTGHAVSQVAPFLSPDTSVLVLYGDVPLINAETLRSLLARTAESGIALVTAEVEDPRGYGRILRDSQGGITGIVEERDANEAQKAIREINTGILAARASLLLPFLNRLHNDNAQGEYYLTDVIAMAAAAGSPPVAVSAGRIEEVLGVNDRMQLAALERHFQRMQAEEQLKRGVTLLDPARFDLRGELTTGRDVIIDVNVVFEGRVEVGDDVYIGPNCVIRYARIGSGSRIEASTVIENAEIGERCHIGPYARLRPDTHIAAEAKIGNFVEVKKASIGRGSKVNHLSYIGDAEVGSDVNIGAGTITCNYDGANKHLTRIGDGAFIGSDSQLVAPVTVGAGATIGAGSTITRDAPPGELTLSRVPQQTRPGWKRPVKKQRKDG